MQEKLDGSKSAIQSGSGILPLKIDDKEIQSEKKWLYNENCSFLSLQNLKWIFKRQKMKTKITAQSHWV